MHPRGSREGRVQMEWSEWDFHILGLGFEVLITGKEVLHHQRGRLRPCLLRRNASIWTRVPLECGGTSDHLECGAVSQLECGGTLGATAHLQDGVNIDLIHSPKDFVASNHLQSPNQHYTVGRCVAELFPQGLSLHTPFPSRKRVERHYIWTWTLNSYPKGKTSGSRKWSKIENLHSSLREHADCPA